MSDRPTNDDDPPGAKPSSEFGNHVVDAFADNVDSVLQLVNFDDAVLEYAIEQIRAREKLLQDAGKPLPPRLSGERTIQALQHVREHQSLRRQYRIMYNQCIVLLVSYFSAALSDLFTFFIQTQIDSGRAELILQEDLRLTFRELVERDWDIKTHAAELFLATQKEISFQDMKSIGRAFDRWLGFSPKRDQRTNNIIMGQAARHAIVHSGSRVDKRLANQVRGARPRNLKLKITVGEEITFEPEEIELLASDMLSYAQDLRAGVAATL